MGWTALIEAIRNDRKDVIKLLLTKGARVDVRDRDMLFPNDHTGSHPEIFDILKPYWKPNGPTGLVTYESGLLKV